MLNETNDQSYRFRAVLISGLVLAVVLSGVLPARAAVGLMSFEARPGSSAGEVIVNWETATETGMVGFRVVRSILPLVQTAITVAIVPSRGSATTGAAYEITDSGLTPGQIYYYWLLELTDTGQQNVLTQAIQAIAPGNPLATHHYYFPVMRHAS